MSSYFCNNNWRTSVDIWQYWLIMILVLDPTHSQELLQSQIVFVSRGTQFSPMSTPAQLLSTQFTASLKMCATACNMNVLCRILDFGVILPQQCRLFEGDVTTMGTIISSPSFNSRVGIVQLTADLFVEYGLPCSSVCQQSRYLTCISNSTCQCMPHTYWNGSICAAQTPVLGATCQQNMSMCREDLNYTCLQFNQCGRKLYLLHSKNVSIKLEKIFPKYRKQLFMFSSRETFLSSTMNESVKSFLRLTYRHTIMSISLYRSK
jgi:hypothetical protein